MMSGHRMAIFDLEHSVCRNHASLSLSLVVCLAIFYRRRVERTTFQLVYAYVHFTFIDSLSLELLENLINIISATVAFLRIPSHSSGLFFIHLFRSRRLLLLFFFVWCSLCTIYILATFESDYFYTVVVATDRSFCCYIFWILFFCIFVLTTRILCALLLLWRHLL